MLSGTVTVSDLVLVSAADTCPAYLLT